MKDQIVKIADAGGHVFEARLSADGQRRVFTLNLISDKRNFQDIEGYDFLDCLLKLRRVLEQEQLLILCQGASRNVHPAGMSRSMSEGLKAYALVLGEKSSSNQLVDIFDPVSIEMVSTIEEQADFFKQWKSLLFQ